MIKDIHIINAHQRWEGIAEGKLNQHFVDTIVATATQNRECHHTITSIEDGYDASYDF